MGSRTLTRRHACEKGRVGCSCPRRRGSDSIGTRRGPGLSPHIYVATITGAKPAQPNGTWRVAINGPFFSVNEDGRAAVIGRVHIVGNRVTFQDGTGPLACRGAQKSGTYMWRLAGKRLSRTRVKDSCVGRRTVFSRPFTVVV